MSGAAHTRPGNAVPDAEVEALARAFGVRVRAATHIGQRGGFGGCYIVRLETDAGPRCLRRWPAGAPVERVHFLQAVVRHARARDFTLFPWNVAAPDGSITVVRGGHVWELTSWAAGRPDYEQAPSPARLAAAAQAIGRMHAALDGFVPPGHRYELDPAAAFAALKERYRTLGAQIRADLTRTGRICAPSVAPPSVTERGDVESGSFERERVAALRLLAALPGAHGRVARALARYAEVFRDVTRVAHGDIDPEHVFFQADKVTGIIDFDETAFRPQAGDVAMLLERFTGWQPKAVRTAIAAYRAIRPLSDAETAALPALATLAIVGWAWEPLQRRFVEGGDFRMYREGFAARAAYYVRRLSAIPDDLPV